MKSRIGVVALLIGGMLSPSIAMAKETIYYFHNDHLGTPQAMSDQNGTIVWKAEYEPFGTAVVDEDGDGIAVTCNLRFPGQYFDAESGLHYNYHRDYDPSTGRYIEPDPVGIRSGTNRLFNYANSNTLSYVDELGLFGAGGPSATFRGHVDFTGSELFDYNLEDVDPKTSPTEAPERHFRDLGASDSDVAAAIVKCCIESFSRAMHRGQDFFSHYDKGYRWKPGDATLKCRGYGHICNSKADEDPVAWYFAERWSEGNVKKWKCACGGR